MKIENRNHFNYLQIKNKENNKDNISDKSSKRSNSSFFINKFKIFFNFQS